MKKEVLEALNKQIAHELSAEYSYLGLSVWFDQQVLKGFAAYFRKQASEEHAHALKLLEFVQDRGGEVKLESLSAPKTQFSDVVAAVKHAQALEKTNTAAINALYAIAATAGDLATQQHLQWFIEEQVEEEKWADEFVILAEKVAAHPGALYMLDAQAGKRAE